ncbi:hypothetical protein [Rhizobium leguminosarum]
MKPWLSEPRGRQLEAFVGVWDIKTSRYQTTEELIIDACTLFNLLGVSGAALWSVEETASAIEALGKKERAVRARENRILIAVESDDAPAGKRADAPITEEALEKMMADSKPQMIDGADMDCSGELDIDPAKLLRKVVSAVISADQGHILYEFPEVLAFFGSRIPSRAELSGHTGVDERMFEAKAKWPNLIPGTPT